MNNGVDRIHSGMDFNSVGCFGRIVLYTFPVVLAMIIPVLVFEEKIDEKIFRESFVLNPYDWIVRDWAFPNGYMVLDDSQFQRRYEVTE